MINLGQIQPGGFIAWPWPSRPAGILLPGKRRSRQLEDETHSLSQLGTLMQNCVACHAAYRLEAVAD